MAWWGEIILARIETPQFFFSPVEADAARCKMRHSGDVGRGLTVIALAA